MKKMFLFFCFLSVGCCLFAGTKVYYYVYQEGMAWDDVSGKSGFEKYDELSGLYSSSDYNEVYEHRSGKRKSFYKKYGYPVYSDDGIVYFRQNIGQNKYYRSWNYAILTDIQTAEEDD